MSRSCPRCCCGGGAADIRYRVEESGATSRGFSFIELFAGVGGFRVGLEAVGGRCVWACEQDSAARCTYAANHSGNVPYKDVRAAQLDKIPPFRVLTAGFPCQDFSAIGSQKGLHGATGALFFQVVRFMHSHAPDAVLLENVKGLVTMNEGRALQTVLEAIRAEGYTVAHALVNSSALVPQYRNRVYIVAFRDAAAASRFKFPTLPRLSSCPLTSSRRNGPPQQQQRQQQQREAHPPRCLAEVFEPANDPFLENHYAVTRAQWRRVKQSTSTKRYGLQSRLLSPSGIADTLIASYRKSAESFSQFVPLDARDLGAHSAAPHATSGGAVASTSSPAAPTPSVARPMPGAGAGGKEPQGMRRPRWLTPRECHRIMGFPEAFRCHPNGMVAYHQLGNAVTPPIIALLGGHVMAALCENPTAARRYVRSSHSAALALTAAATPADGRRAALLRRHVTVSEPGCFEFAGPVWRLVACGDSPLARMLRRCAVMGTVVPRGRRPRCGSVTDTDRGRRSEAAVVDASCGAGRGEDDKSGSSGSGGSGGAGAGAGAGAGTTANAGDGDVRAEPCPCLVANDALWRFGDLRASSVATAGEGACAHTRVCGQCGITPHATAVAVVRPPSPCALNTCWVGVAAAAVLSLCVVVGRRWAWRGR